MKPKYTYKDKKGTQWRFKGNRPVSSLADEIMKKTLSPKEYKEWIKDEMPSQKL